jgi:UPF0755 protein
LEQVIYEQYMMRIIGYGVALILLAGIGLVALLLYQTNQFLETPLAIRGKGEVITVKPGASLKQVARELRQAGLIGNDLYLYGYARIQGKARQIQAGEFFLPTGTTPRGLLDILQNGEALHYRLTLIEGWSFKEVMVAINANDILLHELQGLDDAQIMRRLGYPDAHPEGRFFPDTYGFTRGTTDIQFLQRAYRKMDQELEALWQQRAEQMILKSPYEALILASIIEKETGAPVERPEISGVFSRRLQLGMRLQTDPTVIYGMGEAYQGNIRRQDLKTDTPYNTYTRMGLPPTPICMPGRAAIEAALNPQEGDSLYFVAKGDGTHAFSSNLREHNKAVRRFQLKKQ